MLEVPASLSDRWVALAREARERVEAFLTRAVRVVIAAEDLPPAFVRDLERGGLGLREAFPDLARRVTAIEARERIVVRVACDGNQRGAFYGVLSATGRRVQFDERHELIVRAGDVAAHRIAIDLRAIVRQMRGA